MKTLTIGLLSILFTTNAMAQNWQPINPSEVYCYGSATDTLPTFGQAVRETTVIGSDTVYSMNLRLTSQQDIFGCSWTQNVIYSYSEPFIFQKKIYKRPDGSWRFQGGKDYTLLPTAEVGFSWLCDTFNNITAEVSVAKDTLIWGVTDSIKIITFSNGGELILSKNTGILKFYLYGNQSRLLGLAKSRKGKCFLRYSDIYDWEVGDVFCYYGTGITLCSTYSSNIEYWGRKEVLSKTVVADTIFYLIHHIKSEISECYPTHWNRNETLKVTNKVLLPYDTVQVYIDPWNYRIEQILYPSSLDEVYFTDNSITNFEFSNNTYAICPSPNNQFFHYIQAECIKRKFKKGLGDIVYKRYSFEGQSDYELVGYKKDGFQTPYLCTEEEVGISSIDRGEKAINTFPNPATTQITVETPTEKLSDAKIVVYDLVGREVLSVPVSGKQTTFSVEGLPAGMYFLTVYEKGVCVGSQKIIIVKN